MRLSHSTRSTPPLGHRKTIPVKSATLPRGKAFRAARARRACAPRPDRIPSVRRDISRARGLRCVQSDGTGWGRQYDGPRSRFWLMVAHLRVSGKPPAEDLVTVRCFRYCRRCAISGFSEAIAMSTKKCVFASISSGGGLGLAIF